jgi:hypothetical protein
MPSSNSDPEARWGWIATMKVFLWRYPFQCNASDSPYDLPIYMRIAQLPGTTAFSYLCLNASETLSSISFKNFIADVPWITMPPNAPSQVEQIFLPLDSNANDYVKPHPASLF